MPQRNSDVFSPPAKAVVAKTVNSRVSSNIFIVLSQPDAKGPGNTGRRFGISNSMESYPLRFFITGLSAIAGLNDSVRTWDRWFAARAHCRALKQLVDSDNPAVVELTSLRPVTLRPYLSTGLPFLQNATPYTLGYRTPSLQHRKLQKNTKSLQVISV